MSIRCGCPAEGDEIVFGPAHQCGPAPSVLCICPYPFGARTCPVHSPPEPRYLETLDESERRGD